jgi:hypothetical protein
MFLADRVVSDAVEDIGQMGLRVDATILAVSMVV